MKFIVEDGKEKNVAASLAVVDGDLHVRVDGIDVAYISSTSGGLYELILTSAQQARLQSLGFNLRGDVLRVGH